MPTDQNWREWEGQVIGGNFTLTRYLGGSDHSGVFRTERAAGGAAAIKLIPATTGDADSYLRRWKMAATLAHPHLLRVLDFGRCTLRGSSLVYVVTELVDEDLSQVLPMRSLAAGEAKPVLEGVANALTYLHERGFVHGHIKPSNIMAAGEQLKISSDTVCEAGKGCTGTAKRDPYSAPEYGNGMTAAADMWSLGMTLVEVMTQKLPAGNNGSEPPVPATLPQPFFDIARHTLRRDPLQRWTVAQIQEVLTPRSTVVPAMTEAEPMRKRPRYLVPALAILGLVILLVVFAFVYRTQSAPAPVSSAGSVNPSQPETSSSAPTAAPAEAKPSAGTGGSRTVTRSSASAGQPGGGVQERVLPEAAPSAMRTITGHFRVSVRAKVDSSGNVTDTKFKTRGPSQYFARLSMEAAKNWKFTPPVVNGTPASSEWLINFKFSRAGIVDSAQQVSP